VLFVLLLVALAACSFGAAMTADGALSPVREATTGFGSATVGPSPFCGAASSWFGPEKISGATAFDGLAFEAALVVEGATTGAFVVTGFATGLAGGAAGGVRSTNWASVFGAGISTGHGAAVIE
jgi:hypothetical protein